MSYRPSMCFAPAGMDACAYWRMWLPHLNIQNSSFQFTEKTPAFNEISESDVLVVQRLMMKENLAFLNIIRTHGVKIVYDLDDNLWDVPKFNPAYNSLSVTSTQQQLVNCLEWADVLTVSTRELYNVAQDNVGWIRNVATKKQLHIEVLDNCVDLKLFTPPLFPREDDRIVIGWGGSNTHSGDIVEVWEMLPEFVEKYPNVYLEFVGHEPPAKLRGHSRVKVREWCHISEFEKRYATWNWDIVLAPLANHKFNRSKSSIKMQEAGVISSPCLAQDIAPYRYFTSKKPELKWLLCHDISEWKKKLSELVENRSLRTELGQAMRQNVEENFNIKRTVPIWEEVCSFAYRS